MTTDVQKRVQEAIDRLVESGSERGLQVAVHRQGESVVIAVAGMADPSTQRAVTWALGYALGLPGGAPGQASTTFGVGGVGGSFAYGDSATGIAFALTKNRLTADFNAVAQVSQIVTESLVPGRVGAGGA